MSRSAGSHARGPLMAECPRCAVAMVTNLPPSTAGFPTRRCVESTTRGGWFAATRPNSWVNVGPPPVEEGALAPVTKPADGPAALLTHEPPPVEEGALPPLVEEGALAPVTKPGDGTRSPLHPRGFVTGLRSTSTRRLRTRRARGPSWREGLRLLRSRMRRAHRDCPFDPAPDPFTRSPRLRDGTSVPQNQRYRRLRKAR